MIKYCVCEINKKKWSLFLLTYLFLRNRKKPIKKNHPEINTEKISKDEKQLPIKCRGNVGV